MSALGLHELSISALCPGAKSVAPDMEICSFMLSEEVLKEVSVGEQRLKDKSGLERINKLIRNEDDHTT